MKSAGENGSHAGHQPGFPPNQLWGASPKSSGDENGDREGPPAPSPGEARAGGGLGRGAPSIELARLMGVPSPLPSPHSSVVGRGNRPAAWWCQDARSSREAASRKRNPVGSQFAL